MLWDYHSKLRSSARGFSAVSSAFRQKQGFQKELRRIRGTGAYLEPVSGIVEYRCQSLDESHVSAGAMMRAARRWKISRRVDGPGLATMSL